jgi:murein DD-endopeptidase MepM/ murein hydrolase activator NlpD
LLNASVGVQRVLARLRPVQSHRSSVADSLRRHRLSTMLMIRQGTSQLVRLPAATVSVLRPEAPTRRHAADPVARHVATTSRRSGLAPRSVPAHASSKTSSRAVAAKREDVHKPALAARSARACNAPIADQGPLVRRSLISRIGAERAVPAAAIAIVLLATAISSAPTLGSNGPVGGPTGDGPDARLAVGGVGAAGQQVTPAEGGTDGTIDETGADGGLGAVDGGLGAIVDDPSTTGAEPGVDPPNDAPANVADSFIDDGTLLKPVAVDTTVADGKQLMRTYRVRPGDTLTGIARKFGVTMMTVWWANNLTAKDDLHIGQTLTIPPVNGVVITVGSSDTLESLAAKYGVDAATIVDANALEDPNLVIGQTLTVPGALGNEIAKPKPKPTRTPTRSGSSHASGSSRPVSPPARYSGGKFGWPVAGGYISQYFHYGHYAIDIAADRGTTVKAAASGVVTFAGWKSNGGGYQVWISHGSGLSTTYNHMSSVSVGRGQHVGRGQMVGRVGMTGNATGPHLHFEVWRGAVWSGGTRVNPLIYL